MPKCATILFAPCNAGFDLACPEPRPGPRTGGHGWAALAYLVSVFGLASDAARVDGRADANAAAARCAC
jgi:hypothetical protein